MLNDDVVQQIEDMFSKIHRLKNWCIVQREFSKIAVDTKKGNSNYNNYVLQLYIKIKTFIISKIAV